MERDASDLQTAGQTDDASPSAERAMYAALSRSGVNGSRGLQKRQARASSTATVCCSCCCCFQPDGWTRLEETQRRGAKKAERERRRCARWKAQQRFHTQTEREERGSKEEAEKEMLITGLEAGVSVRLKRMERFQRSLQSRYACTKTVT